MHMLQDLSYYEFKSITDLKNYPLESGKYYKDEPFLRGHESWTGYETLF